MERAYKTRMTVVVRLVLAPAIDLNATTTIRVRRDVSRLGRGYVADRPAIALVLDRFQLTPVLVLLAASLSQAVVLQPILRSSSHRFDDVGFDLLPHIPPCRQIGNMYTLTLISKAASAAFEEGIADFGAAAWGARLALVPSWWALSLRPGAEVDMKLLVVELRCRW